jgi:hypothetical protein
MSHHPAGHPARSAGFDRGNVAVGALVTAVLVILLGAGPLALIVATPREEGANIGGGMLAILSSLLAVGLGSAFTARRAVRRNGNSMTEGVVAGMAGIVFVILVVGLLFVVVRDLPMEEVGVMLQLAVPALGAAFAGAAIGGASPTHRSRRSAR